MKKSSHVELLSDAVISAVSYYSIIDWPVFLLN